MAKNAVWRKTQKEFLVQQRKMWVKGGGKLYLFPEYVQKKSHMQMVRAALLKGEHVPAKVLKDYPKLKK